MSAIFAKNTQFWTKSTESYITDLENLKKVKKGIKRRTTLKGKKEKGEKRGKGGRP